MHKPLLAAAQGQTPSRQPLWFLRQAGRYLPEYQALRATCGFVELCKTPAKASEVTLQPLRRFDLDAAIIFSDILIPVLALGLGVDIHHDEGPVVRPWIRSAADLAQLRRQPVMECLHFVGEALSLTKAKLGAAQTLIGFAGAPFTVASYIIEGGTSRNFFHAKSLMYRDPDTFNTVLNHLIDITVDYLAMQAEAGAEVLMLFDSWAGNLSSRDYQRYIAPSLQQLASRLKERTAAPLIYYSGQGGEHLATAATMGWDVLAVDWRCPLSIAAARIGSEHKLKALQGNLDPLVLSVEDKGLVQEQVAWILAEAKKIKPLQHIFNVGHGVLPTTSIQAVSWAIEAVRNSR